MAMLVRKQEKNLTRFMADSNGERIFSYSSHTLIQRIVLGLALGYIFFFFGERVFWSFPHPGDSLISNILAWLLYSFNAYLTLMVIEYFRVRAWWAVFLAGAFFGWLTEGIFAMTLFGGPFPLGISWTGLAWHALISVFVGWYLVMMLLIGNHYKKVVLFSIGLGVFWGVWSLAWALETPPIVTTPDVYLLHGIITTIFLCISYYLFSKLRPAGFASSRWERIIVALPVLGFFSAVTVLTIGLLAAILPVLFGILYFALKKNRDHEIAPNVLESFSGQPKIWSYFPLLLAPIIAALIYNSGITLPTNFYVLYITTPLGFIFLGISLYKAFRRS